MGIKPNYSELSRKFKMNRHAIKATYMRLDEPPKPRKQRPSVLDRLKDKIDERAEPPAEPLGVHSDKKTNKDEPAYSFDENLQIYVDAYPAGKSQLTQ